MMDPATEQAVVGAVGVLEHQLWDVIGAAEDPVTKRAIVQSAHLHLQKLMLNLTQINDLLDPVTLTGD